MNRSNRLPAIAIGATLAAVLLTLMTALMLTLAPGVRDAAALTLAKHWFRWRPADLVLCGDSNTAAISRSILRQAWGTVHTANLARNGARAHQVIGQIELARQLTSRAVVVMAGTNDLSGSDAEVIQAIDLLLRVGRHELPGRTLLLVSIPLQRDSTRDLRISSLNASLARIASQRGWLFVDTNEAIFHGPLGRQRALVDEVHFSPLAAQIWADAVRATLRDRSTPHTRR